jgi:hypothetical protein
MSAETAIEVQADYTLRGPDFETILVGPVTAVIVDADRLVRSEWRNGFPNWGMYRAALAGDALPMSRLKDWVIAFTVAYGMTGGVRRDAYSDELAYAAGLDALHMLVNSRQMQPYTLTADAVGVHHKTYRCLRDTIYARLKASLDEYWIRMQVAIRQVAMHDRKI